MILKVFSCNTLNILPSREVSFGMEYAISGLTLDILTAEPRHYASPLKRRQHTRALSRKMAPLSEG